MPLLWHTILNLSLSTVYTQYVGSSLFYYTVTLFNVRLDGIVIMPQSLQISVHNIISLWTLQLRQTEV